MFARHPKIAEEFAKKTDFSHLPEKKKEVQETNVNSYITDTGKYVKRHERGEPTKDKMAVGDLISNSSATSDALNKEDMPKAFHSQECADVFLNVKKDVQPIRGGLETSEDDTLMGRLAKRMASRDYIDSMNLGMGTRAQRTGKATLADDSESMNGAELSEMIPRKVNLEGPARDELREHEKTILSAQHNPNENPELIAKKIAKDHLDLYGSKYYEKIDPIEEELKKKD